MSQFDKNKLECFLLIILLQIHNDETKKSCNCLSNTKKYSSQQKKF